MTSSNREPGLRRLRHKSSVASPHSSHDVSPRGQELAHLGKEKSEGRDLSFLALYSRVQFALMDIHTDESEHREVERLLKSVPRNQ